jgi:hypothetical protein
MTALAIRVGGAANRELFEHYEQLAEQQRLGLHPSIAAEDGGVNSKATAIILCYSACPTTKPSMPCWRRHCWFAPSIT